VSTTPPDAGPPQPVYIMQPVYLAPPARGKSLWSMWLGILSLLVGFAILPPVLGFVLGMVALKSEPAGRGPAIAGLIMNGLVLLCLVLGAIAIVLVVVFANMGQDYSPTSP
jgi:hypothetical protein